MHVLAPRDWGGCKASGRGESTWIRVSSGQILALRHLSVYRGSRGIGSVVIACRAFADAKRLALKRGVSRDICFRLDASARGTITRTKNLVTLADPDPAGTASRHFIWWFPKTQKAASLECFAPPSRLGFCGPTFRDFNQQVRAYATG